MKELNPNIIQQIAGRDQAMTFIRDNFDAIEIVAIEHPNNLIKALAHFALAEYISCPIIDFIEGENGD